MQKKFGKAFMTSPSSLELENKGHDCYFAVGAWPFKLLSWL